MASTSNIDNLQKFAVPSVTILVCFLAFSSQYLFANVAPSSLEQKQAIIFNALVFCLLVSYYKSCFTDPGHVPNDSSGSSDVNPTSGRQNWCSRCDQTKPMRAHHCRICKRSSFACILKMDHHCPWTANCVGHRTVPHFMRFLVYAVAGMVYLEYFLVIRLSVLWERRKMPYYHGPSAAQLTHLFLLTTVNSVTLFALSILLVTFIQSVAMNTTSIESLEIERHEALLRRARSQGGYLHGPHGIKIRLVRQEFPYDIGIWKNVAQNMGTVNVFAWFWPFSDSPSNESGFVFEVNDFENPDTKWPPPDPDRMPVPSHPGTDAGPLNTKDFSLQAELEGIQERQAADYRWSVPENGVTRREVFSNYDDDDGFSEEYSIASSYERIA